MRRVERSKEHYFEIKLKGKSKKYTEEELRDLLYEFLKDKAELFMI